MRYQLPIAPHHRRTVILGALTVVAIAAGLYAWHTKTTPPVRDVIPMHQPIETGTRR